MKKSLEIWRHIPGYKGLYEASNFGRIKALATHNHKYDIIFSLVPHKSGYYYICLRKNGKTKSMSVHRLVAKAFHKCPNKNLQVNHKDGNKINNRMENLEWVTKAKNIQHTFTHLGRKPTNLGIIRGNNHLSKAVLCVNTGKIYLCAKDAGDDLGLNFASIRNVCCGANRILKKLKFKYV